MRFNFIGDKNLAQNKATPPPLDTLGEWSKEYEVGVAKKPAVLFSCDSQVSATAKKDEFSVMNFQRLCFAF